MEYLLFLLLSARLSLFNEQTFVAIVKPQQKTILVLAVVQEDKWGSNKKARKGFLN